MRAGPDAIKSRPTLKGRKTDRDLLQAVDELTRKVLEESRPALEGREAEELWHIDCLVHVGAQLVVLAEARLGWLEDHVDLGEESLPEGVGAHGAFP